MLLATMPFAQMLYNKYLFTDSHHHSNLRHGDGLAPVIVVDNVRSFQDNAALPKDIHPRIK